MISELLTEVRGIVSVLSPLDKLPPAGTDTNDSLASLMIRSVAVVLIVRLLFLPTRSASATVRFPAVNVAVSVPAGGVPKMTRLLESSYVTGKVTPFKVTEEALKLPVRVPLYVAMIKKSLAAGV